MDCKVCKDFIFDYMYVCGSVQAQEYRCLHKPQESDV